VIRHLLKLVWKRKRSNALIMIEIFFSFLVVFAVGTFTASMVLRWRKPLGFDYRNVWVAKVTVPQNATAEKVNASTEAMMHEARSMPQVESVGASMMPTYGTGSWTSGIDAGSRKIDVARDTVSDDFATVMRMPVLRGRWFSPDDDAANVSPMVIDADAARALFGSIDGVVGRIVQSGPESHFRVVGIVAPYRKDGEFSSEHINMVFGRYSTNPSPVHGSRSLSNEDLVLRIRTGTPAEFEETLIKRLHQVAPDFPVRIAHMEQMRKFMNRIYLLPAIILGILAAFLIGMVTLGLSGVLWQTITRRTREIGLRRALGATGREVQRQILGEVALLATLASILGVVIVAQLPAIGAFSILTPASFTIGLIAALCTIYAITLLCGLYPSWLAGRVQPAEALHYE